jgi:hypothetical protein
LGKDKGAEFLNTVLEYTERGLTENRLAGAVSEFFGKFGPEAIKDADLASKLSELSLVFNIGLDIFIDKDNMLPERLAQGHPPGLAFSMNNFFATDFTVAENKGSVVTKGFNYFNGVFDRIELTHAKEPEWMEDGPGGPGYYISVGGFGQGVTAGELNGSETGDALLKAADYLKAEIGNQKAAALLENLADEANVMEAIASSIAIVALEDGFDKAAEYVLHLNGNTKNAINSAAPAGLTFGGWTLHAQDKSSKLPGGGLTIHSSMDDIFAKGHLALDSSWQNSNGVGVTTAPKDLNALYSRLR